MNSYRGIESAVEEREAESLPGMGALVAAETMAGAVFVEAEPRGGPETILLVEDEGFVRKVAAEVLESAGYKLVIARSSAEALEAYRRLSAPVDLLLADVVMPGMSGRDLAAEFERLCPSTRILIDERLCRTTRLASFVSLRQDVPGKTLFCAHALEKGARGVGCESI